MNIDKIINEIDAFAIAEIKRYKVPSIIDYNDTNIKAEELARKLKANVDIVRMGSRIIDIKLGECFAKGKLPEHIKESAKWSKEFLSKHSIPKDVVDKVLTCINEHHSNKFTSKESEICANADCYKFLLLPKFITFIFSLGKREYEQFSEALEYAEKKFEEKKNILTLEVCKKELAEDIKNIQTIITKTKKREIRQDIK